MAKQKSRFKLKRYAINAKQLLSKSLKNAPFRDQYFRSVNSLHQTSMKSEVTFDLSIKSIFVSLVILSISICSYGQSKNRREKVKLDPTRPTVYIDFERIGEGQPLYAGDSRERVYLKLKNNTKWSIFVPKFTFGKSTEKAGLYYEIERIRPDSSGEEIPIGYRQGDFGSPPSELKSGESISFSIPNNHLAKNLKIRIEFSYDWEIDAEKIDSFYPLPNNSVLFYSSDLEKFRARKK